MSVKSLFRSLAYAAGGNSVNRDLRQSFIEAVNQARSTNMCSVILRSYQNLHLFGDTEWYLRGNTTMQLRVIEDELPDDLRVVSIECVPALNYKAIVFGSERAGQTGSLIDRLLDYKVTQGASKRDAYDDISALRYEVPDHLYGGPLSLLGTLPKGRTGYRSAFEIYNELAAILDHMSKRELDLQLSPQDAFFLHEELKSNFSLNEFHIVWPLPPRLSNEEVNKRWGQFGSPEAQKRLNQKRANEYELDTLMRSGVWALERPHERGGE